MLQITKANEVVPMSLYLWGRFFQGGQFQDKVSCCFSISSTWRSVRTLAFALAMDTLWVSLAFCWELETILSLRVWLDGERWKWKRWNEVVLVKGVWELALWVCEKKQELSGLSVSLAMLVKIGYSSCSCRKKKGKKGRIFGCVRGVP